MGTNYKKSTMVPIAEKQAPARWANIRKAKIYTLTEYAPILIFGFAAVINAMALSGAINRDVVHVTTPIAAMFVGINCAAYVFLNSDINNTRKTPKGRKQSDYKPYIPRLAASLAAGLLWLVTVFVIQLT